ncbi:MAG: acyltransferase family protein, partial [Paraburkholderia tropica]
MLLSIQYLRGLAAILVLLYHASHKQVQISGNGHEWQFGSSGVDLFFVISGFIMCHVTAHKKIRPVD